MCVAGEVFTCLPPPPPPPALFQIVALSNLNPASKEAARALVPKMDAFTDDEINEMLTVLRRATSKFGVPGDEGAGGGGGGAAGGGGGGY